MQPLVNEGNGAVQKDDIPNLQEFVEAFAPEETYRSLPLAAFDNLPLRERLVDLGIEPEVIPPLTVTLLFQVCLTIPAYLRVLNELGVPANRLSREAEAIVVPYGRGNDWNYGMVILDPGLRNLPTGIEDISTLPGMQDGVHEGFGNWRATRERDLRRLERAGAVDLARLQQMWGLLNAVDQRSLQTIWNSAPIPLAVASLPTPEYNSTPTTPWEIAGGHTASTSIAASTSTAGAVVRDTYGRVGVTGCNHALSSFLGTPNGVSINVAGASIAGTVQECDPVSDSCFVELSVQPASGTYKTSTGALTGVSPRQNESVTFEGAASGLVTTRIQGWSPDLLFVTPYNQSKVFTDRVTQAGDSGAALVDGQGKILGFAFYRTGTNQTPALSAWIWAESVFSTLKLTAL